MMRAVWGLLLFVLPLLAMGCQASQLTERLILREGPLLNEGRISSSLGALRLKDGRVVVIGGSPIEFPFTPITGTNAIEILDSSWSRWDPSGISLPYPISGSAFQLADGRILAFAGVYDFNPNDHSTDPYPKDKTHPQTGSIAAVYLDLATKKYTPVYRPKGNDLAATATPLSGTGITFAQRAFARSIQLRDGRIVRIGGRVLYQTPAPDLACTEQRCRYCVGSQCSPHPKGDHVCQSAADCPKAEGTSEEIVLKLIEIFTPPTQASESGSIKRVYMDEGRRNTAAIELVDGRILITGGKGPLGQGVGEAFRSTYLLDPNTGDMRKGPPMIIAREDHSMALLNDGRVLITGGSNENEKSTNLTEIFDPKTELLRDGAPMDLSREDAIPIYLGPWVLFLGGENSGKSDLIRNSGEAFDVNSGVHISSFFLYSRQSLQTQSPLCPNTQGYAGIDDFAAIALDRTHVILLGGQQGCQDRDGDYISPGKGTRRTLFIELPQQ